MRPLFGSKLCEVKATDKKQANPLNKTGNTNLCSCPPGSIGGGGHARWGAAGCQGRGKAVGERVVALPATGSTLSRPSWPPTSAQRQPSTAARRPRAELELAAEIIIISSSVLSKRYPSLQNGYCPKLIGLRPSESNLNIGSSVRWR